MLRCLFLEFFLTKVKTKSNALSRLKLLIIFIVNKLTFGKIEFEVWVVNSN